MSSESSIFELVELYRCIERRKIDKERVYIKKKLDEKLSKITSIINDLKEISNNTSNINYVIQVLENKCNQMKSNINELEEPFLLSIIGPGKYGKSTLINALLKSEQAKVNDLPKTWKIDIFYGSDKDDNIKVIKKDGSCIEKSRQEVNELLNKEEEKVKESERFITSEIKKLKTTIEDRRELKDKLERLKVESLYKSDIIELQIPLPYNELLNHFRLVDTPGLNQTLLGDTKNRIDEYYGRANGVLWLLDATSIASGANAKILAEIQHSLDKVGGNTDNIIGVLNKIDEIEDKNGVEKARQVYEEAQSIYGKYFTNIVPISAKKAYDGIITNNKELINQSNINELIKIIQFKFQQKAQEVIIDSTNNSLNIIIKECSELISTYKNELISKDEERIKKKKLVELETNKKRIEVKKQIDKIFEEYVQGAKERVEYHAQLIMDIESDEEKRTYIENNIIKSEELLEKLIFFEKDIKISYKKMYNYLSQQSYFNESEDISISNLKEMSQSNIKFDEIKQEDYSFNLEGTSLLSSIGISTISALILGPIGIALGILTQSSGISKTLSKFIYLPKLKNNLKDSICDMAKKLQNEMNNITIEKIDEIELKCNKIRENTFEKFYCNSNNINTNIDMLISLEQSLNKNIKDVTVEEIILDMVVV